MACELYLSKTAIKIIQHNTNRNPAIFRVEIDKLTIKFIIEKHKGIRIVKKSWGRETKLEDILSDFKNFHNATVRNYKK